MKRGKSLDDDRPAPSFISAVIFNDENGRAPPSHTHCRTPPCKMQNKSMVIIDCAIQFRSQFRIWRIRGASNPRRLRRSGAARGDTTSGLRRQPLAQAYV